MITLLFDFWKFLLFDFWFFFYKGRKPFEFDLFAMQDCRINQWIWTSLSWYQTLLWKICTSEIIFTVYIYTHWKHPKTIDSLTFSWSMEMGFGLEFVWNEMKSPPPHVLKTIKNVYFLFFLQKSWYMWVSLRKMYLTSVHTACSETLRI